jgi:mannose/fructose/N-acetylgalactosamine-specific phosphotransferase system component IIC
MREGRYQGCCPQNYIILTVLVCVYASGSLLHTWALQRWEPAWIGSHERHLGMPACSCQRMLAALGIALNLNSVKGSVWPYFFVGFVSPR